MASYNTSIKNKEYSTDIPAEFLCPLTLEIMAEPLMTRMGHSFERSAVLEWLGRGNRMCPLTRTPVSLSDFVTNRALQNKITAWKQAHYCSDECDAGLTECESDDSSESSIAWNFTRNQPVGFLSKEFVDLCLAGQQEEESTSIFTTEVTVEAFESSNSDNPARTAARRGIRRFLGRRRS